MRSLLKAIVNPIRVPVDVLLMIVLLLPAFLMLGYRRYGSGKFKVTTAMLKRVGVFPIADHYYEPLFVDRHLKAPLDQERHLPGLDLNTAGQLAFMQTLVRADEIMALRLDGPRTDDTVFRFNNGSFESGDAEYLYQVLRHLKPAKVLEIGSGNSTRIAAQALARNSQETGRKARHICVEPYEMPWLEKIRSVEVIRSKIEDCQFDWSKELAAGDLLFVDSSHMIRPQGDVLMEYLEIFPQLASGVYIHIHDIFTPRDYIHAWVVDEVRFWNEQYLLEALLTDTSRYEVIAAVNYLKHGWFDELKAVCPHLTPDREPGSFYIRVR